MKILIGIITFLFVAAFGMLYYTIFNDVQYFFPQALAILFLFFVEAALGIFLLSEFEGLSKFLDSPSDYIKAESPSDSSS